jgi:hypothetical protein
MARKTRKYRFALGGIQTGAITEGAVAGDTATGVATIPVSVAEGANAGDTLTGAATIPVSLVGASGW